MNKTNKGGYQILDLGNVDLTTSPTIAGLYELIEGTKKPIRLTRINLGGVEKHDVVSMPVVSGSDYVFENVYGYDLSIDSDGNLSLASTKWATKADAEQSAVKYFHPISIRDVTTENSTTTLALIAINNSPDKIDTLAKFEAWLNEIYTASGGTVRIPLTGSINGYKSVAWLYKSATTYGIVGIDDNGVFIDNENASLLMVLGVTTAKIDDGVNAI